MFRDSNKRLNSDGTESSGGVLNLEVDTIAVATGEGQKEVF